MNINQIAHALNRGDDPDTDAIRHHLEDLETRLDSLALRLCQEAAGKENR